MNVTYRRAVQQHFASALDDADVADLRRVLEQIARRSDRRLATPRGDDGTSVAGRGLARSAIRWHTDLGQALTRRSQQEQP